MLNFSVSVTTICRVQAAGDVMHSAVAENVCDTRCERLN